MSRFRVKGSFSRSRVARKRKYGSSRATGKLVMKLPVKALVRASKKAGGLKTKRGVRYFGMAMKKLGFLQGVHKR